MPLLRGVDSKGHYYKWGEKGKKYYYTVGDDVSRTQAKESALEQARAIFYSKEEKTQ